MKRSSERSPLPRSPRRPRRMTRVLTSQRRSPSPPKRRKTSLPQQPSLLTRRRNKLKYFAPFCPQPNKSLIIRLMWRAFALWLTLCELVQPISYITESKLLGRSETALFSDLFTGTMVY